MEDLVVLGHGDAEDDRRDVLEAVDPLLPLRSLPPDIKQPGEANGACRLLFSHFFPLWCGINLIIVYKLVKIIVFLLNLTHLKLRFLKEKWTSTIPVVLTLVRRISCSVGW